MKSLIKKILKEEIHNRLKEYCFKRLDKLLLDESEQTTHPDYPDSIFFKRKSDGQIIAQINKKNEQFWLDYYSIWSFFEDKFNLEYSEIQEIARDWLDETFKLKGYTPYKIIFIRAFLLDETFKLKGYTPFESWIRQEHWVG